MTPQETFDKVVRHLAHQGGPSLGHDGKCKYRGPNGRMCAAGLFVPDDRYDPYGEGGSVIGSRTRGMFQDDVDLWLLRDLQYAHDGAAYTGVNGDSVWLEPHRHRTSDDEPDGIATRLINVASRCRLSPAVVSECFPETP